MDKMVERSPIEASHRGRPWLARRFGLFNRPAGLGALPCGLRYELLPRPGASQPHHAHARHGIIIPDRQLELNEVLSFELAPLIETIEVEGRPCQREIVKIAVAAAVGGYAREYLEMLDSKDCPVPLNEFLATGAAKCWPNMMLSLEEVDRLDDMVLEALQEMSQELAG